MSSSSQPIDQSIISLSAVHVAESRIAAAAAVVAADDGQQDARRDGPSHPAGLRAEGQRTGPPHSAAVVRAPGRLSFLDWRRGPLPRRQQQLAHVPCLHATAAIYLSADAGPGRQKAPASPPGRALVRRRRGPQQQDARAPRDGQQHEPDGEHAKQHSAPHASETLYS